VPVCGKSRERLAVARIGYDEFMDIVASSAPSIRPLKYDGHGDTMNSRAERLAFRLPGCAAIPLPYRERRPIAFEPAGGSSTWCAKT